MVMRVASSVPVLKPYICTSVDPVLNWTLSLVKVSVVPSLLIREYLSAVNGRNVWLLPEDTASESWLPTIRTLWVYLIVKEASVRSKLAIFLFGKTV